MKKSALKMFVLSMFLLIGAVVGFSEEMAGTDSTAPKMEAMKAMDATTAAPAADAAASMGEMDHSAMMKGMDPSTMTEEQKAMQARMQEFMTPNANHEVLKSLAGSWKASVQFWMDSKGEPQVSDGTSEAKIIMNGRFLEQTFNGSFMGQPFEGRGIYGYDNLRKEYTGLWFDSMSTGIMMSSAQYNSETKVMSEEGSMSCPITNETHRQYKATTTIVDADHYTYETFMKDKDGQEFRSMLITYSRAL